MLQVLCSMLYRIVMNIYIVGLGNPDPQYSGTRHNIGRDIIKIFAKKAAFPGHFEDFELKKKAALISEGKIKKEPIMMILPELFMNNSGKAVQLFIKPKKTLENVIVLHDDIDMPLGRFKIVYNRGSGGHRGVESVRRALKTEAFVRVRVGICPRKKPNHKELLTFLTSKFKPAEAEILKKLSKKISEALEIIATEGHEKAMSLYNKT
uniref:Peptidyl-tRNA hydrolase n=1 Tax=Candidatus Giovannonibacteria bacterium GW2011_GWF2_42_19 TaxID=1618659 RepID=A0A0G0ZJ50_9BACT|nr:MAG: Peptidyl-tRNA hydrolase [Candidatus Giovannonibacteria bacterium GW2011_GWF2_42_19]